MTNWKKRKVLGHPVSRGNRPIGGVPQQVRVRETGQVFPSINQCARSIGTQASAISDVLNGNRLTAKGFTFERVEE